MSPPSPNSRRGVPIRCLSELGNGFRAAQPWYTLAAPEIVTPIVNSFLSHYRTFGRRPVMSYGGKNADCIVLTGRKKRSHVARSGSPAILQLPRDAALYYRQLFTTEGRSGFGELRRSRASTLYWPN